MHPVLALQRHGGIARRRDLVHMSSRRELENAVLAGEIVHDARDRYSLASTHEALRTAHALAGTLSHASAALHWGWEVKSVPVKPHITVRRKRHLSRAQRQQVVVHWAELDVEDCSGGVTSPRQTLVDCLTGLPDDEALAVADSALRAGAITPEALCLLADSATGPGSRRARRIARWADRRAANPFESVLRAIAMNVRGLSVEPQLTVRTRRLVAQPDLVDPARRIVLEADSHAWHSSRRALRRDCRRYNALVLDRWIVLRFTWEQVMFEPDFVRECLEDVVRLTDRQERRRPRPRNAA